MNFLTSKFVMIILPAILKSISPVLIAQMQSLVFQLRETAQATPNPWDDILVSFLEEVVVNLTAEIK